MAALGKKGVHSQAVQQMRETQVPMVRRAMAAVLHQTQRDVNRAFRVLLSHGEELQRAIKGDGASTVHAVPSMAVLLPTKSRI